ncbi:MAG: MFS transporter [Thermomicrobiales bacterium]|nr:MFS transporter [Thermomicrobiales bacterium]
MKRSTIARPTGGIGASPEGLGLAMAMVYFVAVSLRTGLIGVGPLLPDITDDLSLSNTNASLLVALPPILMGIFAVPGGRLADMRGARLTITLGMIVVVLGGGLRAVAPGFLVLVLLTILFGAGIGICQPAMPRLGRNLMPTRMGIATGIFAAGFFTGAVVAASVTGPLFLSGDRVDDWRLPLGFWGALSALTLAAWLISLRFWSVPASPTVVRNTETSSTQPAGSWSPWRDRPTWIVAAIFGAQGLAYYILVAWLPSIYEEHGLNDNQIAILLAIFNMATFPAMVGLPILSDRIKSRRIPTLAASIIFLIATTGLALNPTGSPMQWIWPIGAGFGLAGLFGMGLLMPADTAKEGKTGQTAGMVLAIGYVASGIGPVIAGAIEDLTGSFDLALQLIPFVAVVTILLAFRAPPPRTVAPRHISSS